MLPFYKKAERDLDIRDDFHDTDGPMNNRDGMRMSTAITHLYPMRHCLNLTV